MDTIIKYRGRAVNASDVEFINELIRQNPNDSRRALSVKLCRQWGWVQENGALRDMVCRGMMLALHRAEHIRLPAKRKNPPNPLAKRKKPPVVKVDTTPVDEQLRRIRPLEFKQVRRGEFEPLFNSLLEQHHYLGYCQPVGEHLKYMVFAGGRPIACLAFSSAPFHIGCRDRFIGWPPETRKKNLHLIAYNNRFLILPWVKIRHLASHILGWISRNLAGEWARIYSHPVYFIETFVDTELFKGTCYKAANWIYLGRTTGRGKDDQTNKVNRSIKAVWGYPLSNDFRNLLTGRQ